jgi:hypothetical protein
MTEIGGLKRAHATSDNPSPATRYRHITTGNIEIFKLRTPTMEIPIVLTCGVDDMARICAREQSF